MQGVLDGAHRGVRRGDRSGRRRVVVRTCPRRAVPRWARPDGPGSSSADSTRRAAADRRIACSRRRSAPPALRRPSGAPTPGWVNASRRPSTSISYSGHRPASLVTWAGVIAWCSRATVLDHLAEEAQDGALGHVVRPDHPGGFDERLAATGSNSRIGTQVMRPIAAGGARISAATSAPAAAGVASVTGRRGRRLPGGGGDRGAAGAGCRSRRGGGPAAAEAPRRRWRRRPRAGAGPAQASSRVSSPLRKRWQRTPPVARPLAGYSANGVTLTAPAWCRAAP